jgi:hypothetical protein
MGGSDSRERMREGLAKLSELRQLLDCAVETMRDYPHEVPPGVYAYSQGVCPPDYEPHVQERVDAFIQYEKQSYRELLLQYDPSFAELDEGQQEERLQLHVKEFFARSPVFRREYERCLFHWQISRFCDIYGDKNMPDNKFRAIPTCELIGGVAGVMEDLHLRIVCIFAEDPPWGTRTNLIPRTTDDYLNTRRLILQYTSKKAGLIQEDLGPVPEPVTLPEGWYFDALASEQGRAEMSAEIGDAKEKNGPIDGNRFRWQGTLYDMPQREWRLLGYMWDKDSAITCEVADEVWGGETTDERRKLSNVVSRLHKWMKDRKIDLEWYLSIQGECVVKKYHC